MPEIRSNYQAILDMEQEQVLWKKFYVWNAERTNGAHFEIVQKFKNIGHTEVDSPEDCHYLLGFCPVASRVGTDISEALRNKPPGKPVILVVMHHTHDRRHIVAKSSRQVDDPDVRLTVDCLFYDGKLLDCSLNKQMWADITNHLGVTQCSYLLTQIPKWIKNHPLIAALIVAFIFVIILLVTLPQVDKVEHAHVEPLNNSSSTNKTNV